MILNLKKSPGLLSLSLSLTLSVTPLGLWNLSSLTRGCTQAPRVTAESPPLGHQGTSGTFLSHHPSLLPPSIVTGCGQEASWEARWILRALKQALQAGRTGTGGDHTVVRETDAQQGRGVLGSGRGAAPVGVG